MNTKLLVAVVCVAVAVGACRREVQHEPMKLGAGNVPASTPLR